MKFHGKVGFAISEKEEIVDGRHTGVWHPAITEKMYYGEMTKQVNRWSSGSEVNDNSSYSSQISIVSDPFAYDNFHSIKYVEYLGIKWKVTSVEIMRPRLLLTLGGEYIDG